jgi:hypothetical protein
VTSTGKRVEFLARAIVNKLEDRGLVEFRDAEAGILVVTRALEESFAEAEAVEREARRRLGDRASEAQLEEEMQKIAAEKKIIL